MHFFTRNMNILGRVLLGSTVSGWFDFSCSTGKKNLFQVGLVDQLFQPALNQVEKLDRKSFRGDRWCLVRKWLEKCSIEKRQPYQSKPVAVERVGPNSRTRP